MARSALGRPSYGAVLLQIQGAPALPILPTTLPSQGAPRWALSGALGTSPEPRLGSVYGTTPARLGGIHTRLAMVEPSSLEPAAALVDQSGSLDLIVVDRDAAGRPLAAVPGAIVRATGEPVVSCTAVVPDS